MDTNELIKELTAERDRIDAAIKLLSGLGSTTSTKATKAVKPARKRKKMSKEGRARIAEAQRKRWAAAKKAA
jgi:hypothetical protein